MSLHPLAGTPAPAEFLTDVGKLHDSYFSMRPEPDDPAQRISFGTSGHRGSSLGGSFNEAHILAIAQAICDYRRSQHIDGPLFLGRDTHALSEPALATALEVLAGNDVEVMIDAGGGYTPTPVISHAILSWNRGRTDRLADGIVVTPSHNPPEDGGFKYNPPNGGPSDTAVSRWIEQRANALLADALLDVRRLSAARARAAATTRSHDFLGSYVADLGSVVDLERIRRTGLRIGVDPLGGAGVAYWPRIAEHYGIDLQVINATVDPTFRFMTLDWDGKIRMDCSSVHAMASLVAQKDRFDVAFANDPDHDRHGIVTPSAGLMNPNHFLAVAAMHLFRERKAWGPGARIGKTVVTSSMIDRVATSLQRGLVEMPVGFKWFSPGLQDGSLGFAGEESAGASFLRRDGSVWTTDKDGIIMGLLAAEILAVTGSDPAVVYRGLARQLGDPLFERIDAPVTAEQRTLLTNLNPARLTATELAGDAIVAVTSTAPGNGASIGGLKVTTAAGWFAVRPSGTENIYKLYAESFRGSDHLQRLQREAQALIGQVLAGDG